MPQRRYASPKCGILPVVDCCYQCRQQSSRLASSREQHKESSIGEQPSNTPPRRHYSKRRMGLTSRDKRDAYYRLAKAHGYRARAAFKLIQMEDTLSLLKDATRVVDLCAAPGGWTQVVVERCAAAVVAVDLKHIAPVEGAQILVGDLTSPLVIERIASTLDGKADVVLCDGAPDVLDLGDVDAHLQLSLCRAALACARKVLARGGSFVCKIYRGRPT